MWKKITTIAIILALASLAMSKMVIKGSPTATSRFWIPSTAPHASTPMKLFVALKERNLNVLEERLAKTSDPNSPEYGKHLSFEEVVQISGATDEQIETVSRLISFSDVTLGINNIIIGHCLVEGSRN